MYSQSASSSARAKASASVKAKETCAGRRVASAWTTAPGAALDVPCRRGGSAGGVSATRSLDGGAQRAQAAGSSIEVFSTLCARRDRRFGGAPCLQFPTLRHGGDR